MTCKNHPHIELVPLPEEKGLTGVRLRCPLVNEVTGRRCSWMDVLNDPDSVNIRFCKRCKIRLGEQSLGNSLMCNNCRSGHRKKREALLA